MGRWRSGRRPVSGRREELKLTAIACRKFFEAAPKVVRDELKARAGEGNAPYVVNGFTGSSIWHLLYAFPPLLPNQIDDGYRDFAARFNPILDVFEENGERLRAGSPPDGNCLRYCFSTPGRLRRSTCVLSFGFNFDPSHLVYQGVDYVQFIREFGPRIFHVHMKDAWFSPVPRRSGVFGGHLPFGDPERNWEFRSASAAR